MNDFDSLGARQQPEIDPMPISIDWKGDPLYRGDVVYSTDIGLVHEDQILDYVKTNYRKIEIGGI